MRCPHCTTTFYNAEKPIPLEKEGDAMWSVLFQLCPACSRAIIRLASGGVAKEALQWDTSNAFLAYPRSSGRPPVPADVPDPFAQDYREACLVVADSPKASAALSRRCLQHIIREKAGIKKRDLNGVGRALNPCCRRHTLWESLIPLNFLHWCLRAALYSRDRASYQS
jgi:hypothetical protein